MTRLSETQTTLLSAAPPRRSRSLLPPPDGLRATGKALERTLASLIRRGLAAEVRARSDAAGWRREENGARIGLIITATGLAAIGIDDEDRGPTEPGGDRAPADRQANRAARPGGKLGSILAAVEAEEGASIAELASLTRWQPHTTRAALTRLRQRGFDIRLDAVGDRRAYRLRAAG